MPISSQGLGYTFVANDMASGPISRLGGNVGKLAQTSEASALRYNKAMDSIKRGTKELMAGGLGLMAINSLSKSYGQFEIKLVSAGQIMRATASEMKDLEKAAIRAGIETQFDPGEAAAGLENLGAAGMNAKDAIKTLNPVLDLAAASLGQLGVAESAANVVGVLNAFGDSADYASKRVDQLVKITQMSNFQARDFSIAISQAAAQAAAGDQTFESMTATLGMLRNTNLDASSAATAYREAIRRLAGDERALKKIRSLGLDTMDKQTGKIKDLGVLITELVPKLSALNSQERNLALKRIFGVRGMKTYNAFLASYNKGLKEGKLQVGEYAGAHTELVTGLNTAAGTAKKTRDALLATSEGQRILLKGSLETAKVMAGKALVPVAIPALKAITKALNLFIGIMEKIPGPLRAFASHFIGVGAALMATVGAVRILVGLRGLMALKAGAEAAGTASQAMAAGFSASNKQLAAMPMRAQVASMTAWKTAAGGLAAGVGRALPVIGIATAGLAAYFAKKRADEDAERSRQKEIRAEQSRAREAYTQTGIVADKLRATARKAAEEMLEQSRQSRKHAAKNLLKTQEEVRKRVLELPKHERRIIEINQRLQQDGMTKERRTALKDEQLKLIQKARTARELLDLGKKNELQHLAIQARAVPATKRTEAQKKDIVAANLLKTSDYRRNEDKLNEQLETAKRLGQTKSVKDLEGKIEKSKKRRRQILGESAEVMGFGAFGKKGAAGAAADPQGARRAAQGFGAGVIGKIENQDVTPGMHNPIYVAWAQGNRAMPGNLTDAQKAAWRSHKAKVYDAGVRAGGGAVAQPMGETTSDPNALSVLPPRQKSFFQGGDGQVDLYTAITNAFSQGLSQVNIAIQLDGEDLVSGSLDEVRRGRKTAGGKPARPQD